MKLLTTHYPLHPKKGFTLIELVVFSGIAVILLTVLTDILVATLNSRLEAEATSAVVEDGRYIVSRMQYDILRASDITTPATAGDSGATLTLTIDGQEHTYAASGGHMTLADGTGTDNLNSSETNVSNLSFTRLGNSGGKHTIKLSFRLTSTTVKRAQQQEIEDFTITTGLR